MEIYEGYAVLAYDFKVESSHQDCLFHIEETTEQKEFRWAEALKRSTKDKTFLEKLDFFQQVISHNFAKYDDLKPEPL
jgi:hypothetical protein